MCQLRHPQQLPLQAPVLALPPRQIWRIGREFAGSLCVLGACPLDLPGSVCLLVVLPLMWALQWVAECCWSCNMDANHLPLMGQQQTTTVELAQPCCQFLWPGCGTLGTSGVGVVPCGMAVPRGSVSTQHDSTRWQDSTRQGGGVTRVLGGGTHVHATRSRRGRLPS
jgi:hypothetical protein